MVSARNPASRRFAARGPPSPRRRRCGPRSTEPTWPLQAVTFGAGVERDIEKHDRRDRWQRAQDLPEPVIDREARGRPGQRRQKACRARELRRLTQADIAERLARFTGSPWSAVTVAQAEGSASGNRVRQFTANEIVALARTFDLPVLYFFLPPEDGADGLETGDSHPEGWPWEYLLLRVWGHAGNFPIVADRAAAWAHASPLVTIPPDDVLDGTADESFLDRLEQSRQRYSPDDMLALAFHGLARRRMRGSMIPGEEVATLAQNLRGLANALDAFNNYQPGTFLDADRIRDMGKPKHEQEKEE